MSWRPIRVSALVCCTLNELRGTFWLSDLVFTGLSDALAPSDNENLFTVLISISPNHVFQIYIITGLPVLVMNCQLLFADSLTSTLISWVTTQGLTVLVYFHSHIRLMLDPVSILLHSALMMSEV